MLVSVMLHAMAYGTWQYRAELAKLPPFALVEKLLRVIQQPRTLTAARQQTITFVEVDEPRAKAQREKETETARRFMETDASQVTGEQPKDAKYYSDKSTIAANPKNPTDKEGDTPYLKGTETRVLNSVDVPTPSGVAAPVIVQPGSPGAAANAGQSMPAPAKAAQPTPAQPKAPEKPKEIAPSGIKIIEDEQVAMAPKPAVQPHVVTGTPVPSTPAGVPTIITEPGTPGRELVARKPNLVATGVSRTGVAAFNVAESPFGAYDFKIIKAVQSRWYALIDKFGMYERAGLVTVRFELLDDGQVQNWRITDTTVGQFLGLICEKAIIDSAPFDSLPDNLRALVGKEPREASFTFYY